MELVPNFFKTINPYMPFTYAVEALRECISGNNMAIIKKDALLLTLIGVVCIVITTVFINQGRHITEVLQDRKENAINA